MCFNVSTLICRSFIFIQKQQISSGLIMHSKGQGHFLKNALQPQFDELNVPSNFVTAAGNVCVCVFTVCSMLRIYKYINVFVVKRLK